MKRDIIFSLIIGEITAWFIVVVLKNLGVSFNYLIFIPIVLPILWFIGIIIGSYLGRFYIIFYQAVKFIEIGFLNTGVDFGILNGLIYLSGASSGILYSVFKSMSFVVAVFSSYFWNKYWTFQAGENEGSKSVEFIKFLTVSIIGLLINVGIASVVVNFVIPFGGLNAVLWANVGAVAATAVSLVWNFLGYKLIVFKQK